VTGQRGGLVLLAAALVVPALSGCIASGPGDAPTTTSKARADVTDALGGVEGIVADAAVTPVAFAAVRLLELDLRAETREDGSYAFSKVRPGPYTVAVDAEGFVPASQAVVVRAASAAVADFVLVHLLTDVPYVQLYEFAGFLECGVAWGWNVTSSVPAPPEPVPDLRTGGRSSRPCATANGVFANTTNDRSNHYFAIDAPVRTFVFESVWDTQTADFGERLWIDVVIEGFHCPNYCDWSVFDANGPSPLSVRVERGRFEDIQAFFVTSCEDGSDAHCGHSFFDEGWPLWSRVYPRWECQDLPVSACVPIQQSYTHFVSGFLNLEAPPGYSALSG